MSMNLMAKAMSIKVGNPLRKLVLIKLADNANDEGECWPSYQHIADQCEVSRSTVKSHIRALEDMGLLKREFRRKGELNQSNVFYLTLDNAQQIPPESGGAGADLGGGAGADPRTYHSFEPVKEPLERKKNHLRCRKDFHHRPHIRKWQKSLGYPCRMSLINLPTITSARGANSLTGVAP